MSTHVHHHTSIPPYLHACSAPPELQSSVPPLPYVYSEPPELPSSWLHISASTHLQRAFRLLQLHSSTTVFRQRSSSTPYLHVCMTAARLQSSRAPCIHSISSKQSRPSTASSIQSTARTPPPEVTLPPGLAAASRRCHHLRTLRPLRTMLLPPDLAATTGLPACKVESKPRPDLPGRELVPALITQPRIHLGDTHLDSKIQNPP